MNGEAMNPVKWLLLKAAEIMRKGGLIRGEREEYSRPDPNNGRHCLLGAIDAAITLRYGNKYDGEFVSDDGRLLQPIVALLPDAGPSDEDLYNCNAPNSINAVPMSKCAWWSNMIAKDAEEVARKLEEAAETVS